MGLISKLWHKFFHKKRKQCKHCGKTFYKPIYYQVSNYANPYDWCEYYDWVSPCCCYYWIEV